MLPRGSRGDSLRYLEVGDLRLSVVGLGTWQFGSRAWGYGREYEDEVAPALVQRALDLGITFVDTAGVYGMGRAERIVGRALRDHHDEVTVGTKLVPAVPLAGFVSLQARRSAHHLGVRTIDLYQLHVPNPFVSPATTMRSMRPLVESGRVRRIGVSNHSLGRWQASERALGLPILTNQVRFSLAWPGASRELVPWAKAHDRIVIAYSPLAQGLLSSGIGGADRAEHRRGGRRRGVRLVNPQLSESGRRRAEPLVELVQEIAAAHDATPAQVSLAWLIGHGNVVVIPGARTIEQLEQNAAAADLELTPDEQARLSEAAERFQRGSTA
jgi:aryl-alcohol dehydrogenase-like predicted oxidoreductase